VGRDPNFGREAVMNRSRNNDFHDSVTRYVAVFISLEYQNVKIVIPTHVFLFILYLSLLLTHGFARQSYWPNVDRGSKTFEKH
jgi:hypothetical protein